MVPARCGVDECVPLGIVGRLGKSYVGVWDGADV